MKTMPGASTDRNQRTSTWAGHPLPTESLSLAYAFVQTVQRFLLPLGDPFGNSDELVYRVMQARLVARFPLTPQVQ